MRTFLAATLIAALPYTASADMQDDDGFIHSNLVAIFYHELGHALIDILGLPVFGQEEDAADVLSVLMIDASFEEEAAVAIAYDTAFGFLADADEREREGEEVLFWDTHGPDLQRFYTLVCLFYGANPDEREDVAEELGLPEERITSCEDEFALANDSWGPILDDLAENAPGKSFEIRIVDDTSDAAKLTAEIMEEELAAMNKDYALPQTLPILIDACGEPNAFYDLETQEITMCVEYAEFLANIAESAN